ncbi:hypothetical protein ATANTOWER_031521, partial [Ataeniobius toweri]|nr:hypothetical protein [Ataeniobius toweri]
MVSSLCVSVWLRLSQTLGWYRLDGTEETTLILAQPALRRGVGGDACEGSTVGTGAMCHRNTVWVCVCVCGYVFQNVCLRACMWSYVTVGCDWCRDGGLSG